MGRPEDLYEVSGEPSSPTPVLLHSMTGFLDAGGAGRLAVAHLMNQLEHREIVRFDIDALFDYRARRPPLTFLSDHYGSMSLPELRIDELLDGAGQPFLLLHGPEPDHAWQALAAAITDLVQRFDVRLSVGMHAVPWPAPHTRPIGVTWHATDEALLQGRSSMVGQLEVPGHLAGLLELNLGQADQPAMGFAAHVPHYLVQTDLPRASVALLQHVVSVTGLDIPLGELAKGADAADAEIAAQIAENPQNVEAVSALEAQYDAVMTGLDPDGEPHPDLPSGDEIAAQVERFLSDMNRDGGGEDS
jgi:predicted ATP-grasp superfamily ATP-dependent carboligase